MNHPLDRLAVTQNIRVAWIVPKLTAGGVGPVCRYAAEAVAKATGWSCTVVALHDVPGDEPRTDSPVRYVALGLDRDAARHFLQWLEANPQDLVITNDVSRIEGAFPYFPAATAHVVQIHDSLHRYREVAVRNMRWIDGVTCVARHIEERTRPALEAAGFGGVVATCHNGARFPEPAERVRPDGPLRLLFTGKMDPLIKGVLDLEPILRRLVRMDVPVHLTIVGGRHEGLARRLARRKLDHLVTWTGRIPHDECYRIAAENDVFLMLSRREAFGMVTVEAMSMGCVPIAYDIPSGGSEIIEDGRSGLLVPLGDFKAVARAIKELHEQRELLQELSTGACTRARNGFDAASLGTRTATFLASVMSHRQDGKAERLPGLPPATGQGGKAASGFGYHSLPDGLRAQLREIIGRRPRLAYWVSQNWKL